MIDRNEYKKLCKDIYNNFDRVLNCIYECKSDVPNFSIQICLEQRKSTLLQFDLSQEGVQISNIVTVPTYVEYIPKTNYYETFDVKKCDSLFYYKINNIKIYFAFLFELTDTPEILKTLTKIYIENIVKPLSKFVGRAEREPIYFEWTFWGGFNEELIISKSIVEYFKVFYWLDIYLIQLLSAQKYEEADLIGRILVPQKGTERSKKELQIRLLENYNLKDNLRRVRKLMEISNDKLSLVLGQRNSILGYANDKKPFESQININGYLNLEFIVNDSKFAYKNGVFRICSSQPIQSPQIPSSFQISTKQLKQIQTVMNLAKKQKHGTLIIVGSKEDVVIETNRLYKFGRGIKIGAKNLYYHPELIDNVTSIDGALFMDVNCVCYGIGYILDGDASAKGTSDRGARYNSAINYIESAKKRGLVFFAAIFSEDKSWEYYI